MAAIVIVADSTVSLLLDICARHGIAMARHYLLSDVSFAGDVIDFTPAGPNQDLLGLADDASPPTTATPSPGDYLEATRPAQTRSEHR